MDVRDMYLTVVREAKPDAGFDPATGQPVLMERPFLVCNIATERSKRGPETETRWLEGWLVDPATGQTTRRKVPHGEGPNQARDVYREVAEARAGRDAAKAEHAALRQKAMDLARELEREREDHKRAREREQAALDRAQDVEAAQAEVKVRREQAEAMHAQIAALKTGISGVDALRARVLELEDSAAATSPDVKELHARIEARDARIESATREIVSVRRERDELLADATAHIKALQDRVAELEAQAVPKG